MRYLLSLFLFSILISCGKDEEKFNEDYLIFGHFYGECIGEECVETFKLTQEKLYEDSNDSYSAEQPFDFSEIGEDKHSQVVDFFDSFPDELWSSAETTYGCPDCADGGGLYIQYKLGDQNSAWRIDQDKSQIPEYLHDFVDEVNEKIGIINN